MRSRSASDRRRGAQLVRRMGIAALVGGMAGLTARAVWFRGYDRGVDDGVNLARAVLRDMLPRS